MEISANNSIPVSIRQIIEARLAEIAIEQGVRFILAVESGSRAWGFPSPDSDYDIRFVYAQNRDAYLNLEPARDVIEQPIVDDIDLNGWDIRKFLHLLLKSNAVASEWLASPIRYLPDDPVVPALSALADAVYDPRGIGQHYANLGRNAADRWLAGDSPVPVKRYFYSLRPALAIRALRLNPDSRPPMNLQELIAASELPNSLTSIIDDLVAAKALTQEIGECRRNADLDAFILSELGRADDLPQRRRPADSYARANAIFLSLVNE